MIRRVCVILLSVALILGALPLSSVAQDAQVTCDGGPNDVVAAAQAAYDAQDFDAAMELVLQAETLCKDNPVSRRSARALKGQITFAMIEPGLVNVGDHSLFMSCVGEGSPTVIFENGWGQPRATWRQIPEEVAQITRVCTYDRWGHGQSDGYPPDRIFTAQDQVDDLIRLLEAANIEPPYVLVAHCGAGMNPRLFADQHRDWVAGLVMVDAFVPGLFFEKGAELLAGLRPFAISNERLDLDASLQQVDAVGRLGDMPVVVLTAYIETPIAREDWLALQAKYAAQSTNSRHFVAVHSPHFIMNTEPELIVEAIRWVIEQAGPAE